MLSSLCVLAFMTFETPHHRYTRHSSYTWTRVSLTVKDICKNNKDESGADLLVAKRPCRFRRHEKNSRLA